MKFPIPQRTENPVCHECLQVTPGKHDVCGEPCSHLVSYASHQAQAAVTMAARVSSKLIIDYKAKGVHTPT